MSRALTSDKATNVTEAGTVLLRKLLLFSSPVSWMDHVLCVCVCVCVCLYVCLSFPSGAFCAARSWSATSVFDSLGLRHMTLTSSHGAACRGLAAGRSWLLSLGG